MTNAIGNRIAITSKEVEMSSDENGGGDNMQVPSVVQSNVSTRQLTVWQSPSLNLDFDTVQRMAKALYASGYFRDVQSIAQAVVKVMAGQELGIPPFASMNGIHIIKGVPSLGATLIASLVDNHPRYDFIEIQGVDKGKECIIAWYRDGKAVGQSSFDVSEAKQAGLLGKTNWQTYPSDMLFARALTRGARRFAPGVFSGAPIYSPDELGASVDLEGNIVEGEVEDLPPIEDIEEDVEDEQEDKQEDTPEDEPVPDEIEDAVQEDELPADEAPKGNGQEQLLYRNNSRVSMGNKEEVATFQAYEITEGARPPSKGGLRKWYQSGQPQQQ